LPVGVRLDLGATAKSLAADRAATAAYRATDRGVLVALGGDVATAGPAPLEGWSVHVTDDHRSGPSASGQTIAIRSGGLATSSIATRRWLHHGRAMHHVLDPGTGLPVQATWRTVSVAAATCAEANVASTASIVLGNRASAWLAMHRLPARLVDVGGIVKTQGGWPF
jgi:thiamine biosynthesis lipoprotein